MAGILRYPFPIYIWFLLIYFSIFLYARNFVRIGKIRIEFEFSQGGLGGGECVSEGTERDDNKVIRTLTALQLGGHLELIFQDIPWKRETGLLRPTVTKSRNQLCKTNSKTHWKRFLCIYRYLEKRFKKTLPIFTRFLQHGRWTNFLKQLISTTHYLFNYCSTLWTQLGRRFLGYFFPMEEYDEHELKAVF